MTKLASPGDYVESLISHTLIGVVKRPWDLTKGQVFRVLKVDDHSRYLLEGDWEPAEGSRSSSVVDGNYWIHSTNFVLLVKRIDFTDILNPKITWEKSE